MLLLSWLLQAPCPGGCKLKLLMLILCLAVDLCWVLQAQTAHVEPFLAVTSSFSWLLQAPSAHVKPLPGCYKPKKLMLIHSWLLDAQTAHVAPFLAVTSFPSWLLQSRSAHVDLLPGR